MGRNLKDEWSCSCYLGLNAHYLLACANLIANPVASLLEELSGGKDLLCRFGQGSQKILWTHGRGGESERFTEFPQGYLVATQWMSQKQDTAAEWVLHKVCSQSDALTS